MGAPTLVQFSSPVPIVHAAYNEGLLWQFIISYDSGTTSRPPLDPVLQIDWIGNTGTLSTELYNAPIDYDVSGTTHSYFYEVAGDEAAQSYFKDLADLLQATGVPNLASSSQWQLTLTPAASMWLPDFYGIINPLEDRVEGTSINVIAAVINQNRPSELTLSKFDISAVSVARFLTNKPQEYRTVCLDDHETLAVWSPNNVFYYNAYSADGTQIGLGFWGDPEASSGPLNLTGVGPYDIPKHTFWYQTGAYPNDSTVRYYEIGISSSSFEVLRYYINRDCCRKVRLHFLNQYGCFDSISFDRMEVMDYEVSSTGFERQRPSQYGRIDRGRGRIQATGTKTVLGTIIKVPKAAQAWLMELARSPLAFIQETFGDEAYTDGMAAYTPIKIKDGTFRPRDSTSDYEDFTLTFEYANDDHTQRN